MMHNRHFFGKTQLPNKYIGWVLSSNFRTEANKKATKLSSHIWKLKEEEKNYNITWKFVSQAKPFSPVSGVCQLCTREKLFILYKSDLAIVDTSPANYSQTRNHCE